MGKDADTESLKSGSGTSGNIRHLSLLFVAQATLLGVLSAQPDMLVQALAAAAQSAQPAAEGAAGAQGAQAQAQAAFALEAARTAAAGAADAALADAVDDEGGDGGGGEPPGGQLMIELEYPVPGGEALDLPAFPASDDDAPPTQRVRLV